MVGKVKCMCIQESLIAACVCVLCWLSFYFSGFLSLMVVTLCFLTLFPLTLSATFTFNPLKVLLKQLFPIFPLHISLLLYLLFFLPKYPKAFFSFLHHPRNPWAGCVQLAKSFPSRLWNPRLTTRSLTNTADVPHGAFCADISTLSSETRMF